jgi:hypothetical protein
MGNFLVAGGWVAAMTIDAPQIYSRFLVWIACVLVALYTTDTANSRLIFRLAS